MTTTVLCALRGAAETAVVRALDAAADDLRVSRRCPDLQELLAAAAAGLGQVAVVSADLPDLDREAVHHLHGSGVWVVGVSDERTGWDAARVGSLGVDAVVDAQQLQHGVPHAVVGMAQAAARGERPGSVSELGASMSRHREAEPGDDVAEALRRLGDVEALPAPGPRGTIGGGASSSHDRLGVPGPGSRGSVIAVWGPTGAPGRTTIALNLAAELATQGSLLVDADTYGGTVAQMLGLLDEAPGIAAAARAASTGRLDVAVLAGLTPLLEGGLRVLTGLSRADRWPELPESSLEPVWATARSLARWTVVDCGFAVEQDEALSYDTRAPRRNAATLSALAEADVVVVVGAGDPIGLQRLVRALGDLSELGVPVGVRRVVVNRVRASASGPRPAEAIAEALRRYAGVPDAHMVPDDRPSCDGAVLAGRTLLEHAPASPVRRSVAALAASLSAGRAPAGAH